MPSQHFLRARGEQARRPSGVKEQRGSDAFKASLRNKRPVAGHGLASVNGIEKHAFRGRRQGDRLLPLFRRCAVPVPDKTVMDGYFDVLGLRRSQ